LKVEAKHIAKRSAHLAKAERQLTQYPRSPRATCSAPTRLPSRRAALIHLRRVGPGLCEPLVRCQLLASEFYEALKRALRVPELSPVERWAVMAAANQCLHAADASISPGTVALEPPPTASAEVGAGASRTAVCVLQRVATRPRAKSCPRYRPSLSD
jgi:hypothetical protein